MGSRDRPRQVTDRCRVVPLVPLVPFVFGIIEKSTVSYLYIKGRDGSFESVPRSCMRCHPVHHQSRSRYLGSSMPLSTCIHGRQRRSRSLGLKMGTGHVLGISHISYEYEYTDYLLPGKPSGQGAGCPVNPALVIMHRQSTTCSSMLPQC